MTLCWNFLNNTVFLLFRLYQDCQSSNTLCYLTFYKEFLKNNLSLKTSNSFKFIIINYYFQDTLHILNFFLEVSRHLQLFFCFSFLSKLFLYLLMNLVMLGCIYDEDINFVTIHKYRGFYRLSPIYNQHNQIPKT